MKKRSKNNLKLNNQITKSFKRFRKKNNKNNKQKKELNKKINK